MRTLLLMLLCIWLSSSVSAQKIHFTDTSNVWKEFIHSYNDGAGLNTFETYHYIQDSVIDTFVYRLFNFNTGYCFPCLDFIREDTIAKKVFIKDRHFADLDTDVVLMDYNLIVGDTFEIKYYYYGYIFKYVVTGINYTLINSVWHKVWYFSHNLTGGPYASPIVIEGIGCIQHPTYMIQGWGCAECPYEYMYCFSN